MGIIRCNHCYWKGDEDDLIINNDVEECPNCEKSGALMDIAKYSEGDQVRWTDPDEGKSSGIYTISQVISDNCGDENIYLISNGTSEAEVYEHELS